MAEPDIVADKPTINGRYATCLSGVISQTDQRPLHRCSRRSRDSEIANSVVDVAFSKICIGHANIVAITAP